MAQEPPTAREDPTQQPPCPSCGLDLPASRDPLDPCPRCGVSIELDPGAGPAGQAGAGDATDAAVAGGIERTLQHPDLTRHYRIDRKLGQGGMGAVFVAEQLALARPVALKFVLGAKSSDLGRFRREGQVLSQLSHPNILKIFAIEVIGDMPVLVLELIEGRTLKAELTEKGKLALSRVREVGCRILDGLEAAHRTGIVHRDLKTENIFLPAGGGLKILDFGLARESAERKVASLTAAGTVVGTPAYMSPEQCQGHRVDARADLYSLGVILHELVCGQVPFGGTLPMEILLKHLQDEPPSLSQLAAGIPPELEALVKRALAKKPEDRFASAAAFRDALEAVPQMRSRPSGKFPSRPVSRPLRSTLSRSTPPPRPRSRPIGVALLIVAIAAAGGVLALRRRSAPLPPISPASSRFSIEPRVKLIEGEIQVSGLPRGPILVGHYPTGRPDLARTEAILMERDGAVHPIKVGPVSAGTELQVRVGWVAPDRRTETLQTHVVTAPPEPGSSGPVEHFRKLDVLDSTQLRELAAYFARDRVYAATPALEAQLGRLVDLPGNVGPTAAGLLEALEVLGQERSERTRILLGKLEPGLEWGGSPDAWASCVAALRLRELAPAIVKRVAQGQEGLDNDPSARIVAAALGSLGEEQAAAGLMTFLRDNHYVCQVAASLALMRSVKAADALAEWVDARSKLPAHMDSVVTWAPLLALGEAPPGSERVTAVLKRRWAGKAALARRVARARRASPESPGWPDWAPFEIGLCLRNASRPPENHPVNPADLTALSGKLAGPLEPDVGTRQDPVKASRWLAEEARSGSSADESALADVLVRSLGEPLDLPCRWNVDPPSTALWCLGRTGKGWGRSTLELVTRIAAGRAQGARSDDAAGWVRRLRAVEALSSQAAVGSSARDEVLGAMRDALSGRDPAVRWAALCLLARSDAPVAGSLGLPGPAAELRRVDAVGVWQGTGVAVKKGDRVALAAWGAWQIARRTPLSCWTDADGYDPAEEAQLLKSAKLEMLRPERFPRMGLEARIGRHAFRAGRWRRIEAADSGELVFRPWIPLAGGSDEAEFKGPALPWLLGFGPNLEEVVGVGMRGFVTVAVEVERR